MPPLDAHDIEAPDKDERRSAIRSALEAAKQRYALANPQSLAAHHEATSYLPGGNTRSVLHYGPFPLLFHSGEGAVLTDADGHRYDDFLGEFTAGLYGHSHPVILEAIENAMAQGLGFGGTNIYEVKLAALLGERFPAVDLVRFTNSGTEANLMALAAARVITGRDKILVFSGSYHGGVLAFRYQMRANAPFDVIRAPYNDIDETRAILRRHSSELAAVIVEPMLQSAGCIPAAPQFLDMLRSETAAISALLIFDEVVTSRLHPTGMHGALGIKPDLVTLGKYIGGGLSFGAFGGAQSVMERFDPRQPDAIVHSGTFNNNTLSMAVAHAGLSLAYPPATATALNARGEELRTRLNLMSGAAGAQLQFTGIGSIMCAHMMLGPIFSAEDAAHGNADLKDLLFFHLLESGIYLAKRGMLSLSLATTEQQINRLEDAIRRFLEIYRPLLAAPARA